MKKVLVTGGCGFIGFNLVKKLIEKKYYVDVIDNLFIGKEAKDVKSVGANFIGGDIRAMDNIPNSSYDYIFHLAALSRIQPSFENPNLTFSINVDGTRQVIDYVSKNGGKLIYGGSSSRHHNPQLSPYAMSKHMGEEWIKMYKKNYNLNAEIVRFYNVYGPGELVDSNMAAVIGKWRASIKKGEPIIIHGDGEQRRDFTHVDYIVDGLIKISETKHTEEDAWELGTGKNYSLNEVAKMFKDVHIKYVNDVKGNYRETLRVNDNAIIKLKLEPKDNLREYISEILSPIIN